MPRWKNRPPGSNWGDYGPDDRIGRLNDLTPDRVLAGVREVQVGRSFCLSLPLDLPGGSVGNPRRHPPRRFAAVQDGACVFNRPIPGASGAPVGVVSDDAVLLYTQYSTQWDSFAHVGGYFDADGDGVAEPVYYNGWRAGESVRAPEPSPDAEPWARFEGSDAGELGIDGMAVACLQGRGVLVDLHTPYGRARHPVTYDDLMRIMERDGVEVERGDMLALHTGYDRLILELDGAPTREALHGSCAGLDGADARLQRWIDDSGLCAIVSDNRAVELLPGVRPPEAGATSSSIHEVCLFKLGVPLGEMWFLAELAAWLREHGRSRFLLTAPPLRMPGVVGSPVTPIATV